MELGLKVNPHRKLCRAIDEVIDFYEDCRFDLGMSLDHVILGFEAEADGALIESALVKDEWSQIVRVEGTHVVIRRPA